ncbi:MAG: DNA translocase FtsK 4TM domain-containing protein [Patescibacteria group bacterium]
MAKRRRRQSARSVLSYFDWSINPETTREVVAVLLGAIGILELLALVGAAGKIGAGLDGFLTVLFGGIRVAVPIVLIGTGVVVWDPNRFALRSTALIGALLAVLSLSGVVHPYGGVVGKTTLNFVDALFGSVAGTMVLFVLMVVGILLVMNTSLRGLLVLLKAATPEPMIRDASGGENKPEETRVSVFEAVRKKLQGVASAAQQPVAQVTTMAMATKPHTQAPAGDWEFPPLELLNYPTGKANPGNVVKNVEIIEKSLKDFGVEVAMGDVNIGPTVTQYTLKPHDGVKLTKITSRANDLALTLAAPGGIRIEAPIPGKAAVGIEVPNKTAAMVTLRELLETEQAKSLKSNLSIPVGRDAAGAPIIADLKKMPHLLIAGSTGSGKSIAINSLIVGMLYQNTPSQLRMLLVDPKRVEFTQFNDIPHLLAPVITEPDKTVNTLKWALIEMERRYKRFQEVGSRDIDSYNAKFKDEQLPYIVIVIDELADLMATSAKEVEGAIVRLAQMARAVGMHLIVATQRPSVDVITGLLKANITTRVAFAVASQIDSRTIIDVAGAEKLLGRGDMLFLSSDFSNKPKRIQGCLITEKEIKNVTDFLKEQSGPQYDEEVMNYSPHGAAGGGANGGNGEIDDDMYEQAKETVINAGKASASLLQRRLRVGYARAARLLDLLEDQGVIGPADGAKPRDVLTGLDSGFGPVASTPIQPTNMGPRPPQNPSAF